MTLNYTQTIARQSTGLINADKSLHELWTPPAVPHAWDTEFDGSFGGYSTSSLTATEPDPYASFTGNCRYSLTKRPGWVVLQPGSDGVTGYIYRAVTVPTNLAIMTRAHIAFRYNSLPVAGDTCMALLLWNSSNGHQVYLRINEPWSGSLFAAGFGKYDGAWTSITTTGDVKTFGQPLEYFMIQKRGTSYDAWVAPDNGSWLWLGTTTHATTMDNIGIYLYDTSGATPGCMMSAVDFVRCKEDATSWPP